MAILIVGLYFTHDGVLAPIIIAATIISCAALGVYGYNIGSKELVILRLGWSKKITFMEIVNVEFKPYAMIGSLRTFGIGGLFGYVGNFKNGILGSYSAYATNQKSTVLIETKNQKFIVTPDDPIEFTQSLKQAMESAA